MRKLLFGLLILWLAFFALPALAETYVLDEILAAVDIPDSYITLTPHNLSGYTQWLESRDLSAEDVAADFASRGVLLQCWSEETDVCVEITAVQHEKSLLLFDVNEQDSSVRGSYRVSHYPNNAYETEGYTFSSSDWKNTPSGRFLILRYMMRDGGEIAHRGLMRRTIRNGYEITFDMKVIGRNVTNKDNSELNKIWNTFRFVEILPLPPAASAKINITKAPPNETNSANFTIEGTASRDVKLTAVVMGLSYPTPVLSDVEVGASGKFKLPIKLPKEGVFLVTITGEYSGEDVIELAYPVTYQHTLLTVNIDKPIGDSVTTPSVTVQGTCEPSASIQVLVNNELVATKRSTAAGKFKIDIDTSAEGPYEVVLVFSKKNLADRRVVYTFNRVWTEADMIKELRSQAIKPGYATLVNNIAGYDGRIMGYKCYMVDVTEAGGEWIARMALTRRGEEYRSVILVVCGEEPRTPVGEQVMMYGTCVGMSLPAEDDETQMSYPCFELLLFAAIE
jgi:hypothetical protein